MKVIIVSPLHPINRFNGASQRINRFIRTLRAKGVETHTIYTCQDAPVDSSGRIAQIRANMEKQIGHSYVLPSKVRIENEGRVNALDDFFPADIADEFARLVREIAPDCVIVNYVFLSKLMEYVPKGVYKVIDTHDKLSRKEIYESANLDIGFFCTTEEEEIRGLKRADLVLCIQKNEEEYFRKAGIADVITIGHLVERAYLDRKGFRIPRKVGFMGSNHVFNAKSVEAFLASPRHAEVAKAFEFVFAGAICNNEAVKKSGATLLGRVESERDFYEGVDIVINPVLYGTGLKIKTIEALSHGVPVVGTDVAFDGISSSSPFHACANVDELCDRLEEIRENPAICLKLSNISRATFEGYRRDVLRCYDALLDRIHAHARTPSRRRKPGRIVLHHVVNPVGIGPDSDLYLAQPVTFRSMHAARRYAEAAAPEGLEVRHHMVFVGDEKFDLHPIEDCEIYRIRRTIRDEKGFEHFKPLPMLADILSCVKARSGEDGDHYIIYTNVDIALTPAFYEYVHAKIREGHDAIIINRRTISKLFATPEQYADMVAEYGQSHPGFDCFVFKAECLDRFHLSRTIIGVHLIGRVLLWNVVKHARNPLLLREKHLTFHLGDDNSAKDEYNNDLVIHNMQAAIDCLRNVRGGGFEERVRKMDENALKCYYMPNIFRDDLKEKKRVIFIHSMFRTGSSYVWQKFNRHRGIMAFYEPLHESLNGLTLESLDKASRNTSNYHPRLSGSSYWENYRGLLRQGEKGVANYKTRFAYHDYTNNGDEDHGLRKYVEGLAALASNGGRRPVFQFNRTALRQEWFRRTFPDSLNIYLFREPRSQFASYVKGYEEKGKHTFTRTDFALVDQNIESGYFRGIKDYVDMPALGLPANVAIYKFFSSYDAAIKRYGIRQIYFVFYWNWIASLLAGLQAGSEMMNISLMSRDLVYRRRMELMFLENFLYFDFDDCAVPSDVSGVLSPEEYAAIEAQVIGEHRQALLAHREALTSCGLKDLARIAETARLRPREEFRRYLAGDGGLAEDAPSPTGAVARGNGRVAVPLSSIAAAGGVSIAPDGKALVVQGEARLGIALKELAGALGSRACISIEVARAEGEEDLFLPVVVDGNREMKLLYGRPNPVCVIGEGARERADISIRSRDADRKWLIRSVEVWNM